MNRFGNGEPGEVVRNKVYLVMHYDYDDSYCESVWRTKAGAEAHCTQVNAPYKAERTYQPHKVEEHPVQ